MKKIPLSVIVLFGASILLVLLWFPSLWYPIWADNISYALLGESFWQSGVYSILGEPHAKYMPLYSILTYPFTSIFGYHVGMRVLSLLGGFGVLLSSYALIRRTFSVWVALGTVLALLMHPTFILMAMKSGADLFFITFAFLAINSFLDARDRKCLYLLCGLWTGLACLTRYNGVTLFPLFLLWGFIDRKEHRKSLFFWLGGGIGLFIFSFWLIRNFITFGSFFATVYVEELDAGGHDSLLAQFFSNLLFYINPLHNVFPIFFVLAIYGVYRFGRKQVFLLWTLLALWIMSLFWSVPGMRYLMSGFPIVLAFAIAGAFDLAERVRLFRIPFVIVTAVIVTIGMHTGAQCLYTYGACNAWFDRTIGVIPAHLGLWQEGMYAQRQARAFFNTQSPLESVVYIPDAQQAAAWQKGVFRDDILVTSDVLACPVYIFIEGDRLPEGEVVFRSGTHPEATVILKECLSHSD